jgi:desulfoferrodoxin-like iron-binding protein
LAKNARIPLKGCFSQKGGISMAQLGEVFTCPLCGNEVTVTKAGGNPEINCCGQPMVKKNS